jgi:hypothetical protein
MKQFFLYITLCLGVFAAENVKTAETPTVVEIDPFWLAIREGSTIYLTQRYVDEGETPENIKLAIYMNRLAALTTGKSLPIKNLFVQAPSECTKRLVDDGQQLQNILIDKYYEIDAHAKADAIKLMIALICNDIGPVEQDLFRDFPPELVETKVTHIHQEYSKKYGLHLETPKEALISRLENISFKSLSFNTSQLFLLVNYINKKCKDLGISLEIESIPFCDDLKSSLNSENEMIYSGTLNIKKPISFKLENGNVMDLIRLIDLNYRVQVSYTQNKITLKSPVPPNWKSDLLSYRHADALTALIFSPSFEKIHKKEKSFQIYGVIEAVTINDNSSLIYLNPYLSIKIPNEQNEELLNSLAQLADKNQLRTNSIYTEKLKVIIQANFVAKTGSATQVNHVYLPSLSKFLKL